MSPFLGRHKEKAPAPSCCGRLEAGDLLSLTPLRVLRWLVVGRMMGLAGWVAAMVPSAEAVADPAQAQPSARAALTLFPALADGYSGYRYWEWFSLRFLG